MANGGLTVECKRNLAEAVQASGLSAGQVASKLRMPTTTLERWCAGKSAPAPSNKFLPRVLVWGLEYGLDLGLWLEQRYMSVDAVRAVVWPSRM